MSSRERKPQHDRVRGAWQALDELRKPGASPMSRGPCDVGPAPALDTPGTVIRPTQQQLADDMG
jgi:hypothetical protein